MQYYKRIKEIREDRDIKQKEIAEILQTDQSYYSKYERGLHPMTADQIIILCKYYNLSADYMLGIIDEPRQIK
nr:MAG TPA: helix-turn-helix domain protein [Inoviridae sp.]